MTNPKPILSDGSWFPFIPSLCECQRQSCNEILWNGNRFIKGHHRCRESSFKIGTKKYEELKNKLSLCHRSKLSDGSWYPKIPVICNCMRPSCYEICWDGQNYVYNHHNFGNNNCMKDPEFIKTRSGIFHPLFNKHLPEEVRKKIGRKGEHRSPKTEIKPGQRISPETEFKKGEVPSGKDSEFYGKPPSIKCNRSKGDWYDSPLQGTIFLRSQWEIKYAKFLDSQNISWYYEFKTFHMNIGKDSIYAPNGKDTVYHPDFWILSLNKFIEVKGRNNYESWNNSDDSKLKSDKFREEHKEYNYEVLFGDDLLKLGINLKTKEPKYIFKNKQQEEELLKQLE